VREERLGCLFALRETELVAVRPSGASRPANETTQTHLVCEF